MQGHFHQAIPTLERGLALAEDASVLVFMPVLLPHLAVAYARCGHTAKARNLLDQFLKQNIPRDKWFASEAALLVGRLADAQALVREALASLQQRQLQGFQVHALWLMGEIALHREPPKVKQAKEYYRQALALATELGMRPLQAHCHHGLGKLYRHMGPEAQAHIELSRAMDLYRTLDMTFWFVEK